MANHRDGGKVIIGVEAKSLTPEGLSDKELATWKSFDVLAEAVNSYAKPSVGFDLDSQFTYESKAFVIIEVQEFNDIPILCTQDYCAPDKSTPTLRKGACYVRSRYKPETAEIPSEEEMRELLELAIDKGVTKFVNRAIKAGLLPSIPLVPNAAIDEALFRKQMEEMG